MASACRKCNYFPVRCRCAEILLEVENKQLKDELKDYHNTEQGEFTKNIMANLERGDCGVKAVTAWLKEVCRRYDWLVKRNANLQAGTLQTVADSNKLQLQAAEEISQLQAENKQLVDGQVAKKEAGS